VSRSELTGGVRQGKKEWQNLVCAFGQ